MYRLTDKKWFSWMFLLQNISEVLSKRGLLWHPLYKRKIGLRTVVSNVLSSKFRSAGVSKQIASKITTAVMPLTFVSKGNIPASLQGYYFDVAHHSFLHHIDFSFVENSFEQSNKIWLIILFSDGFSIPLTDFGRSSRTSRQSSRLKFIQPLWIIGHGCVISIGLSDCPFWVLTNWFECSVVYW